MAEESIATTLHLKLQTVSLGAIDRTGISALAPVSIVSSLLQ